MFLESLLVGCRLPPPPPPLPKFPLPFGGRGGPPSPPGPPPPPRAGLENSCGALDLLPFRPLKNLEGVPPPPIPHMQFPMVVMLDGCWSRTAGSDCFRTLSCINDAGASKNESKYGSGHTCLLILYVKCSKSLSIASKPLDKKAELPKAILFKDQRYS